MTHALDLMDEHEDPDRWSHDGRQWNVMQAVLMYYDPVNDISEVALGDHRVGIGGQGDSYCYGHQSFDCWENFTPEERDALFDVDYGTLL